MQYIIKEMGEVQVSEEEIQGKFAEVTTSAGEWCRGKHRAGSGLHGYDGWM